MNTHAEYRRHSYRTPDRRFSSEETDRGHPDPTGADTPGGGSRRIAWVRPTELASFAGTPIGRGIDLHAELLRRARRTPAATSRTVRRAAHRSARTPSRQAPGQEGVGL